MKSQHESFMIMKKDVETTKAMSNIVDLVLSGFHRNIAFAKERIGFLNPCCTE